MTKSLICTLLLLALAAPPARADDPAMAMALAASAEKLYSDGQRDKARQMCYRSLANDKNCPQALYLMAKLLEEDGQGVAAGMFYVKAHQELTRAAASQRTLQYKAREAEISMRRLNPFASGLQREMEKYTFELEKIVQRSPDSLTEGATFQHAKSLNLAHYVAPEKMPRFKQPSAPAAASNNTGPREQPAPAAALTPEIERALKGAGWKTIAGSWKKVGVNVYEATDGRLEADFVHGALSVLVHRGGKGKVTAFVRNEKDEEEPDARNTRMSGFGMGGGPSSGFGAVVEGNKVDIYSPSDSFGGSGSNWEPWKAHTSPLPDGFPKDAIVVSVARNNLDIFVNNKKEKKTTYQIRESGQFVIIVKGTKTLELPQARGQ
ncbi:MAG: hypothetical protein M5U26_29725 [Planctomycetota bacterium]|nr:hypothetical protein [Planctomycetota bacterium]